VFQSRDEPIQLTQFILLCADRVPQPVGFQGG
jgi:hypothetical protein